MKTKSFGILTAMSVACAFQGSYASTTTGKTDIYSETLYLEKSSAEVPGSFESSARFKPEPTKPAPLATKQKQAAIETIAQIEKPKIKYMSDDSEETADTEPVFKKHKTQKVANRSN